MLVSYYQEQNEVSVWADKKVLEMDNGVNCATL